MNPWLNSLWNFYAYPFSGDVNQNNSPVTSWLSPHVEFNFSGNRRVEAEIISDIASYGKQLGILSEAIIELAEGKQGQALNRLRKLIDSIENVKDYHLDTQIHKVRSDLEELKKSNKKAFEALLSEYK